MRPRPCPRAWPARPAPVSRVVTTAVVDDSRLAEILRPRRGLVTERTVQDGAFEASAGPVSAYRRTVDVEHRGDGRSLVRQTVDFQLAVPWFGWLFVLPARHRLGRLHADEQPPWWGPPEPLDARASTALASLAALSVVSGYLGTLLTQTITFAAREFGADKAAQGVALSAVRADILIALAVVARADRRGRRSIVLTAGAAGCLLTAVGALSPGLGLLAGDRKSVV
jgi:hypothetical protein